MSHPVEFIPPLTVPDKEDANTVWLALLDYKLKMYGLANARRADGDEDAQVWERIAERADRLADVAYVQYRDAQIRDLEGGRR